MIFHFDNSYGKLPESFYIPTNPAQVPDPSVLLFNDNLARELDLSPDNMDMEEAAALFSGNKMIPGSFPIAQAYAGHQFGNFTMLWLVIDCTVPIDNVETQKPRVNQLN
ncbi:MAG: protein adenylyltransferase SelO family protein [Saprospiraceae bacterium]|nr:protein adenylyltransferase SelO family protein [Saprospiraceae bacterium]